MFEVCFTVFTAFLVPPRQLGNEVINQITFIHYNLAQDYKWFCENIATTVNVRNPAGDHRKGKPYKLQPHLGESYLVQFNTMKAKVRISHHLYD